MRSLAGVAPGALLALALVALASAPARAQDRERCLGADEREAVELCQRLVDGGRADADVWAKFASSLYRDGQQARARRALERALTDYPDDADLARLRDVITSATTEEAALERARARNRSAMSQGQLKLACLTRDDRDALDACRGYLERTDVDGDRIRTRLAALESALAPAPEPPPETSPPDPAAPRTAADAVATGSPADAPTEAPADAAQSTAAGTPAAGPREPLARAPAGGSSTGSAATPPDVTSGDAPAEPSTEEPSPLPPLARAPETNAPPAPDPASLRRRARIAEIQRLLGELGFAAGLADGIAGPRTRDALAGFFARVDRAPRTAFDEGTLALLREERARLEAARRTLGQSRAAARDGRHEEALALLERAENESALVEVPPGYRRELETARRLALDAAARDASVPAALPDSPSAEPGDGDGDDALATLLQRIGALERRLDERRETERRIDERLRRSVAQALQR